MEEESLKKLAEFKVVLEEKIQKLEYELESLKVMRNVLDSLLIEKGFKRAKISTTPPIQPVEELSPEKQVNVLPIKTVEGKHLADIYLEDGSLRVIPSQGVVFQLDTPPFKSFLIERVLEKMRLKDYEASLRGEIPPENMLDYDVKSEDGILKEILIMNVTEERLHELKSTICWTLEKMYEKTILQR